MERSLEASHSIAFVKAGGWLFSFALFFLVAICLVSVAPQEAKASDAGLVLKNGKYQYYKNSKPIISSWKTVDGARYYFDSNGNAVTGSKKIEGAYFIFNDKGKLLKPSKSKLYTLKKGVFYVNPKGNPAGKGWIILKDKLYYVGVSGKCVANKTKNGIVLTSTGAAKKNTASKLKILVMKKLKQLTKPSMTKRQKLRACFTYCISRRFMPKTLPKDVGTKGWAQRCALQALETERTQCYGMSCAFAAFAYELGYKPTIRESRKVHAWVMINGKAYDNMGPRFGGTPQKFNNVKSWKFTSWSS